MDRKLITSDCHIAPPFELVDQLPEHFRSSFTRVERGPEGAVVIRPNAGPSMMLNAAAGTPVDDEPRALARAAIGNVCPEAQPSFDADELLEDLARDGVNGAVLIGAPSVFSMATGPADAEIAYCQLVNDWAADAFGDHLDRLAPGIHLPIHDPKAAAAELERAAGMGLRPGLLPDGIWGRPYHAPEWEPLWEVANALKVPLTLHVGGTRQAPNVDGSAAMFGGPGFAEIGWYNMCGAMGETLGWFTYGGVFERYPDLHVVMTEGYAGWLAFAMQFFDHHFQDSRLSVLGIGGDGAPKLEAPPSFYLKRQSHATFMWDPLAIRVRDLTGIDCLMWGNDYPHFEGSFPSSEQWIDKQFAGVPEDDIDQMVRGNAARVFGLTV